MHTPDFDTFQGYLESHAVHGCNLELRLVTGGFNPAPSGSPVLCVVAQNVEGLPELLLRIEKLVEQDDYLYVERVSSNELAIHSDYEEPLSIRGAPMSIALESFSARDFERLARINHDWGLSESAASKNAHARINAVNRLALDQMQRLDAKRQGHATGSTARTLYDQHLAFIERLVETLKGKQG